MAGEGPRATVKKRAVYRRARACPSPCIGRGNGLGLRAVFAQVERSRGTGPRATGQGGVFLAMRRSGSGDPELRSSAPNLANLGNPENPAPNPAPAWHGEGQALALRCMKTLLQKKLAINPHPMLLFSQP